MPKPPFSARFMIRCVETTARWSRARRIALAILAFAAAVLLEQIAPPLLNVTFIYLVACAAAVFCLGERWGLVMGVAGACASALANHWHYHSLVAPGDVTVVLELWGLLTRMLCFALLTLLMHGFNGILELERWRGNHDGLTGALNKQAFEAAMVTRAAYAKATGRAMLFAYMDLDGFKAVNDQHGHAAGDRVLQLFSNSAAQSIRDNDLFARIGGDEFCLLLTFPAHIDGARLAELLHGRLSAILQTTGLPVTCSMGALVLSSDRVDEVGPLFEQADALMYEVKRSGKNGVRISQGGVLAPALRSAYGAPLDDEGELDRLLAWIDVADRRSRGRDRRVA